MLRKSSQEALRCSFCSKSQKEVAKLIAGPRVYICDECIATCNDILAEDRLANAADAASSDPKAIS